LVVVSAETIPMMFQVIPAGTEVLVVVPVVTPLLLEEQELLDKDMLVVDERQLMVEAEVVQVQLDKTLFTPQEAVMEVLPGPQLSQVPLYLMQAVVEEQQEVMLLQARAEVTLVVVLKVMAMQTEVMLRRTTAVVVVVAQVVETQEVVMVVQV
jgi:hypothetical protein